MPSKPNRTNPAPEKVEATTSTDSARKTNNKPNSTQKTRSRTPHHNWNNSFLPALGGTLTRKIAYDRDGKLNETISNLYGSLSRRFDMKDTVGALLVDLLIADYWRLSQGLKHEKRRLEESEWPFDLIGTMPTLTRYTNQARRSLDGGLKMLRELEKEAAEAEAFEAEFGGAKAKAEPSNSSSPEGAAVPEKSDETAGQAEPSQAADEGSGHQEVVAETTAQGGEAQANANDNAAAESASTPSVVLTSTDNVDSETPAAAPSKPAEAAAEVPGVTIEGDSPKAA